MKFCSNCGQQIDDHAKFCAHCGTTQGAQVPTAQPMAPGGKRLHCPNCKGAQLSPIVETDVQGGYALNRSLGRKWSVSAIDLKSTHRNYWMCGNCGHKFRNIQNLEEEIATYRKGLRATYALAIIMAIPILITLLCGESFPPFLFIATCALIIFLVAVFKNKLNTLGKEKDYLEKNCFN